MLQNLLFFILSALFLIISSTFIVKSLTKISHFLKISEFTTAFILMALATSAPELFVGISSALSKNPSLSLGNVIGASIIDLTLLVGIFIFLSKGINIKSKKIGKDIYYMTASVALLIILFFIGRSLSRIDGIILVIFFMANAYRMLKKKEKYSATLNRERIKKFRIIFSLFIFLISIVALFIAASYAVKYASLLAIDLKLPQIIIGLFLLSIATTLPELTFGLRATEMGHREMALGDITGAVITNTSLVAGVVAIIHPIKAEFTPFVISALFLLLSSLIFIKFLKSNKRLEIKEGMWLILIYIAFVLIEFFIR